MKTLIRFAMTVAVVALCSLSMLAQAVGDLGSTGAGGSWTVATNWVTCATPGTWAGAGAGTTPTAAKNVWIRSGSPISVPASGTRACLNLTIDSGGVLTSATTLATPTYLSVSGNVTNNGTMGGSNDGLSFSVVGSSISITGSGSSTLARMRSGAATSVTINTNLSLLYNGGTTGAGLYCNGFASTYTISAGKTVTFGAGSYFSVGTSGSGDPGSAVDMTIVVNGTVTLTDQNLNLSNNGKTTSLTVNNGGIINLGKDLLAPAASLATAVNVTVNSGGQINVNSVGGKIDLSKATTTMAGTVDFADGSTSTRSLGATANVTGTIRSKSATLSSAGTLNLNSGSTVEYYGGSALSLSSSFLTYSNLNINTSGGVTLGGNTTVNGALTLLSGNVTTGASVLTLGSSGSVSRTSGHIVGDFEKNVGTGSPSLTYEIGDATNYTPVSVSFTNVTVAGLLKTKSTAGGHPAILSSGINSGKNAARYWTLTNSGIAMDSYDAVFNFVAGDVTGGANTGNFIAQKYDGSWSSLTVGSTTSTSTQIIGATSFSDFIVGEVASSDPTISISGILSNFGNVTMDSLSGEQSYTVAGVNLTDDITITPPTGFEISLTTGSGFGTSPIVLTQSGGNVGSTTIYVRFAPLSAALFSDVINHTSSGASTQTEAVAGKGLAHEPTSASTGLTFTNIAPTTMTVSWTNGDGASHLVIARAGNPVATNPTDGTTYTANAAYGSGSAITAGFVVYAGTGNSVDLTNLVEGTIYYFSVMEYNGSGGLENYYTTGLTGLRGANIILANAIIGSNWSSTASWLGGVLPTSTDNVKLNSNTTVIVDDANAACKSISFGSVSTAKLSFASAGVLSIYGDFNIASAATNVIGTWAAGGKLKFTGPAATQLIANLNTSKTSTSQTPFYEVIVDKSAGKVITQTAIDADNTILIVTSLEIVNGTFELGQKDDLQGWDLASATTPTITVQSGGTFNMVGGASNVRSGTSGTNPIGLVTIYGQFNITTTSTVGTTAGGINIENGGMLTVNAGWASSQIFNCGAVVVKSGGTFKCLSTSNFWYPTGASLDLQDGGLYESTGSSTTVFPASFTNNGTIRYYRTSSDQTLPDMNYKNLQISYGIGSNYTYNKTWTLGANRTVSGNLTIDDGASLVLAGASPYTLNVLGSVNLTSGRIVLNNNDLAVGGSISGGSATQYIATNGNGRVIDTLADTQSSTFPVAHDTLYYNPLTFTNTSGGTATYTARIQSSVSPAGNVVTAKAVDRTWEITGTGQATLAFSWTGAEAGATLFSDTTTGSTWKYDLGTDTWIEVGGSTAIGTPNVTTVTGVTSFSRWAVGTTGGMPVEVANVSAHAGRSSARITWTTLTEVNISEFVIERREVGATSWQSVGVVKAAGSSSSSRDYSFSDLNVAPGRYAYRLKAVEQDGSAKYFGNSEVEIGLAPKSLTLAEAYPNPFNPSTKIEFTLPENGFVTLKIYNIVGQEVATLFAGVAEAGRYYQTTFDAKNMTTGLYFSRLEFNGKSMVKKLLLTK